RAALPVNALRKRATRTQFHFSEYKSGSRERAASLALAAQDLVAMRRTDAAYNIDAKQSFLVATQTVHSAIHANK
ncbi:MAG: hypothetical protein AAFR39_03630, partial [Pseudomonadota bacterium]